MPSSWKDGGTETVAHLKTDEPIRQELVANAGPESGLASVMAAIAVLHEHLLTGAIRSSRGWSG
jgi:hypothetical protein